MNKRKDKTGKRRFIIVGLTVLMFVLLCFYLLGQAVFIVYIRYPVSEKILAILFFLAECFVSLHAFGFYLNVYRMSSRGSEESVPRQHTDKPPVAILIPARHEQKKVLIDTLASCFNIDYPAKTLYLLDDSSEEKFKLEAEEVAAQFGAKVFRRAERHGAKAGIINDCLKSLDHKYVAIFDADQNPISSFLNTLVPMLEADERLAFVQTPQFYSNVESNKIAFASNIQQAAFYEYVCEGKSSGNTMICCGTNVVLRRAALEDVGGLDESTVTEDFATSFKMHLKGWKTRYYNHVYTFGMGPEDLGEYLKQQNRWASGNVAVLRSVAREFFRNPFRLKLDQWFEYFITGSYYLIGWAYLFLLACPIMYLLFNLPSFFMNPIVYSLTYLPYFVLSLAVFYISMRGKRYTFAHLARGQLLFFLTLPVYMRASLSGIFGLKSVFQVTAKGSRKNTLSYVAIWPQCAFWAVSLIAIVWGVNRLMYERSLPVLVNIFWVAYHFILFTGIFYFNDEESLATKPKKLLQRLGFAYKIIHEKMTVTDPESFGVVFSVPVQTRLAAGTLILAKILPPESGPIVFEAAVLKPPHKKGRRGWDTEVGVVTALDADKARIKELLKT